MGPTKECDEGPMAFWEVSSLSSYRRLAANHVLAGTIYERG